MLRILLILSTSITILLSCQIKSDGIKRSKEIIERDQFTLDLFIKYDKKNYDKWQELKHLLANDLMSARELGVIDCRGLDINSYKLTLTTTVAYKIDKKYFKWSTYQAPNGKCLKLEISRIGTLLLSNKEARTLLSGINNYHFKKLGLVPSSIIYKRTQFHDPKRTFCGDGTYEFKDDLYIIKDGCQEIIYYGGVSKTMNNEFILYPKK